MDSQPAFISEELAKQFKTHWTSTRINTFMTFMSNQKTNENFKEHKTIGEINWYKGKLFLFFRGNTYKCNKI